MSYLFLFLFDENIEMQIEYQFSTQYYGPWTATPPVHAYAIAASWITSTPPLSLSPSPPLPLSPLLLPLSPLKYSHNLLVDSGKAVCSAPASTSMYFLPFLSFPLPSPPLPSPPLPSLPSPPLPSPPQYFIFYLINFILFIRSEISLICYSFTLLLCW